MKTSFACMLQMVDSVSPKDSLFTRLACAPKTGSYRECQLPHMDHETTQSTARGSASAERVRGRARHHCCPRRGSSRVRPPPGSCSAPPAGCSPRLGRSEREAHHAPTMHEELVMLARLEELRRREHGHEASRRAQRLPWAAPGGARRPQLQRRAHSNALSTRERLGRGVVNERMGTETEDQMGTGPRRVRTDLLDV